MANKCQYCEKTFSSKYTLAYHQKTAQYCLKIQKKIPELDYICVACGGSFITRQTLYRHNKKCKITPEVLDAKINEARLWEKIKYAEKDAEQARQLSQKLMAQIDRMSKQTTITNNTINNTNTLTFNSLQMLTPEWIKSQTIHLTRQHVSDGVYGLASYAVNYPLKNRAISTDKARRAIKFKDESGKIVKDSKGVIISKMICDSLAEPVDNHFQDIREDIYDRMENKELPFEAIDEVRKACMLSANLKIVSSGQDHEITRDLAVKINDLLPTPPIE